MSASKEDKIHSFTILGSYSGRNAGDAAILASIMKVLSETFGSKTLFEVPTTHPHFVREHYGEMFNVRAISTMPWTGSVRLLGLPTFRSISRTDATLITDGIIFDVKLFNPLFNFLITLVFLAPWAKFRGKKLICYNVGVGPLRSYFGRRFARWVCNSCDLITVRDEDSLALLLEIGVHQEIVQTADAVFNNWAEDDAVIAEICQTSGLDESLPILGLNVTTYVDQWLSSAEKLESRESFVSSLAHVLAKMAVEQKLRPVLFVTQVMDHGYAEQIAQLTAERMLERTGHAQSPIIISNRLYSNHEIMGVMRRCRLFVGMRLHSLILATRAGVPVVGLVYAPKVRSFLKQLGTADKALELASLDPHTMYSRIKKFWDEADAIGQQQQAVALKLSSSARHSAALLADVMGLHPEVLPAAADSITASVANE